MADTKAACIPAQQSPAKPHTSFAVSFAIMPEPSNWVKSVTANNHPRQGSISRNISLIKKTNPE